MWWFLNCATLNYKDNTIYFDFQILVGKSMENAIKQAQKNVRTFRLKRAFIRF